MSAAIDESLRSAETPEAYVTRLAVAKAAAVWSQICAEPRPVLAADTAVVLDDRILGKPADRAAAAAMLEQLSGRTHRVLTAVALHTAAGADVELAVSEVRFRATTPAERRAYADTAEPLDKAGGYGIQGYAAVFVEHLAGSYSAVVGLPLFETGASTRALWRADVVGCARGGMTEEILVNATPRETRAALVEAGVLQEVHIERTSRRGLISNI